MVSREAGDAENKSEVKGGPKKLVKKVGNYIYDFNAAPIGAGGFATVYKGYEYGNTTNVVAIKVISKDAVAKYGKRQDILMREIEVLKKLKGKHILEFQDALSSEGGNFYIITSFCKEGNLTKLAESGKVTVGKALRILSDIAQAFLEIEALQLKDEKGNILAMMHRDLKPENILIRNGMAILADFGFAKFVTEEAKEKQIDQTKLGTQDYMSPQQLDGKPYSYKCDIWAMGMVTYELIAGKLPWRGATKYSLVTKIKDEPLKFTDKMSENVQDLLSKMLSFEEKERPDWKEILEHPAMKEMEEISNEGENGVKVNAQ